jgi:hypothetical protein
VRTVVYLADLKLAPAARGGLVLARLFKALDRHLEVRMGYGIVMDGTGSTPLDYTGRGPFPAFTRVGAVTVLKLAAAPSDEALPVVSRARLEEVHAQLACPGSFLPSGGRPEIRSEHPPTALACAEGSACGLLEDTRLGKRLLLGPGQEIRAAHLSRLAWRTPEDGARLIRQACHGCADWGVPNLFLALSEAGTTDLMPLLGGLRYQVAPATVYGCGLDEEASEWWVDSAEI